MASSRDCTVLGRSSLTHLPRSSYSLAGIRVAPIALFVPQQLTHVASADVRTHRTTRRPDKTMIAAAMKAAPATVKGRT
jgi:hypothetical protein